MATSGEPGAFGLFASFFTEGKGMYVLEVVGDLF
jgi:hypothetical protein